VLLAPIEVLDVVVVLDDDVVVVVVPPGNPPLPELVVAVPGQANGFRPVQLLHSGSGQRQHGQVDARVVQGDHIAALGSQIMNPFRTVEGIALTRFLVEAQGGEYGVELLIADTQFHVSPSCPRPTPAG